MSKSSSLFKQLEFHFKELKSQREGLPVYLIEHDLRQAEVQDLFEVVSEDLSSDGFDIRSGDFEQYLPLLVAATEVAYEYEGNGTDYWPKLEEALDHGFSMENRNDLRDLFENFHQKFNGPVPPDTDWTRNFSIICWPIANALLPLDVRLPFAESLSRLTNANAGGSSSRFGERLLRLPIPYSSARYRTWLSIEKLASDFAQFFLLKQRPGTIFPATLNRIEKDMAKDRKVRRALRNARIRNWNAKGKPASKTQTKLHGELYLRNQKDRFQMEAVLPRIGAPEALDWISRNTRNGRWQPKPWGIDQVAPLTPTSFLFGTSFLVPARQLFQFHAVPDFFCLSDRESLPKTTQAWATSVAFEIQLPIVFTSQTDGLYKQSHSGRLRCGNLLALESTHCESLPSGLVALDTLGSLTILKVVENNHETVRWLKRFSLKLGTSINIQRFASPSVTSDESNVFLANEILGLRISDFDGQTIKIEVERDGEATIDIEVNEPGVFLFDTSEIGDYSVRVFGADESVAHEEWDFRVVNEDVETYGREVIETKMLGVANNTLDLSNRNLKLEFAGVRGFKNLIVELGFSTEEDSESVVLHEIPAAITHHNPVWDKVISDKTLRAISRGSDIFLDVSIKGITTTRFLIENDAPSVWWEEKENQLIPVSESEQYDVHSIGLTSDILSRAQPDAAAVQLHVPVDSSGPNFEWPCLVSSPNEIGLPAAPHHPSRLPRRMGSFKGFYGLREWTQKFIALSTAKPTSTLAALCTLKFRDSYLRCIQEVTCGKKWTGRQRHQDELLKARMPMEVFVEKSFDLKAGINDFELDDTSIASVKQELMGHLSLVLPKTWWSYPTFNFSDSDGEKLDQAFKDAIESYAESLNDEDSEYADRLSEFSPFTDTAVWQEVLERTCEHVNGGHLAELVMPLDGGDSLLKSPVLDLGLDEVTSLIWDWLSEFTPTRRTNFKWNQERLKVATALYLHPAFLRSCEWESVLEVMMRDRITSRAIAFVAWKRNQLETFVG